MMWLNVSVAIINTMFQFLPFKYYIDWNYKTNWGENF